MKSLHTLTAGGIIGGFAAVLVLSAVRPTVDLVVYPILDRGILSVFRWVITYPSLALVVTSCLYSLFFGWGILRFGWVACVEYAQGVFDRIVRDQTANTDAITGATTTSKAYMKAVEDALSKAAAR